MSETNATASAGSFVKAAAVGLVTDEDAAAFILLLDDDVTTSDLVGVERCVILRGFDELEARLGGSGSSVQRKPVVVLSSDLPPCPDHLATAIAAHWDLGGSHVLSRVKCSYSSKTGTLKVEAVLEMQMQRFAFLPGILTMPVSEALLPHSRRLLFVPSGEFSICMPHTKLSEEQIRHLEQTYHPSLETPAQAEHLARAGALDHSILLRLPVSEDPQVANLIAARKTRHQQLVAALETKELSVAGVEETLTRLEEEREELPYLRDQVDSFLLALSRCPGLLLGLPVPTLACYISQSRQCSYADEVAANLAVIGDELCLLDTSLITPLFEFFACSLSSVALNALYCAVAGRLQETPEPCIRLAQSMQRFGDETSLGLLLAKIYRTNPRWLRRKSLLRCFQPLLSSQLLPSATSLVGEETIRSIQASTSLIDRFRSAVVGRDRSLALQILRDGDGLASVDFLRWMDGLRSLTSELQEMKLAVADIIMPIALEPDQKKLAATIFSDRAAIESLRRLGALQDVDDINAVALCSAGDKKMLSTMISDRFEKTRFVPMDISGDSVSEVFQSAAASTRTDEIFDGPLVSVVMSAFDPDLSLMKIALDSISNQTWKNVEVIVVDDASDQHAAAAIGELSARYRNVELIRVPVNSGPYHGRNLALRQAEGEFIAIHDADDWSHPQRLAAQVSYLMANPQARAVTTEHIRIDRLGCVSLEAHFRAFGDGPMTSVFRAEIFQQVGGFAPVRSRGDLEMRERLAAYYGHQANVTLPLPMALCYADSATLSRGTTARKAQHLHLFRKNISARPEMTGLFRDAIPLRPVHQVPVPMMLRSPQAEATN